MNLDNREEYSNLFEQFSPALSQTQKQVLQLYLFEDLQIVEIAGIMATSRQAVNDALRKGINKLEKFKNT